MRRLAALLLLCTPSLALAQSVTGAIVGTVTDPTGDVIAGANITVTNTGTNAVFTARTNAHGDYRITNLPSGLYKIHVDDKGFKSLDINHAELLLNQTLREDVKLSTGSVEQTVEISAEAPVIQTDSSSISDVIDSHSLTALPTNGRTLDTFVLTAPGNTGEASGSNPKIAGSQHWGGTTFTVDGVGYNDLGNGGGAYSYQTSLTTQPSLDTIQEVKVESNSASAEYSSSVAISMVTKGGTNQFHGSVWEFNRNTLFAANDYFSNANGIKRPPYNRNEFGLAIGGPIYRNKTFFFFSAEKWVQRTTRTGTFSVPTADQRNGCFNTAIKDPNTGSYFSSSASCPNGYQIPTSRLDSRMQAILKYVPLPTKTGNTYNLVQVLPSRINVMRYTGRIDHNITSRDRLSLSGSYSNGGSPYSVNLSSPVQYNNYSNAGYTTETGSLTYTRIITPNMTNEFRASYFDHASVRLGQNLDFDPSSLFNGLYEHNVGGLPTIYVAGMTSIADRGGSAANPQITEQLGDTFTWVKGKHEFKAGADMAYSRVKTNASTAASTLGYFYFGYSRYTNSPLANAMLGLPNDSVRSTMTPATNISFTRWGFYAQDTWHMTPRLTLSYGLRYELQTQPQEKYGTWANFDFEKGVNVVRSVNGQLPVTANATMLALYPYATSESVGWGSDVIKADHLNFAPRFGFAYRPFSNDDTVLRGGFGIFYNMPPIYQGIYQLGISNPPFRLTQEYDSNATKPTVTLADPFSVSPVVTANPVMYAVDHQIRNTYSQQWNLTVEQRLPYDIGLRASYLGNKAVRVLYVNYNMNLPQTQSSAALQASRPYQPYGDIYSMHFGGDSMTHQLQLQLTKRYKNSLYFQSSLNWTKGIDDVPETGSPQNPYNPGGDRGNADGVRHLTFYFQGGYDLPFGRGQRWLNGNGVGSRLVEGWSVSAIARAMTGAPLSVSFSNPGTAWYATRANAVDPSNMYAANKSYTQWLNPNAFAAPAANTFGNSARNLVFGPPARAIDLSITKTSRITEQVKFVLRGDAFNLTNTTNFDNPTANVSVPSTFGVITATNAGISNRTLQVGGKIVF